MHDREPLKTITKSEGKHIDNSCDDWVLCAGVPLRGVSKDLFHLESNPG